MAISPRNGSRPIGSSGHRHPDPTVHRISESGAEGWAAVAACAGGDVGLAVDAEVETADVVAFAGVVAAVKITQKES